MYSKKVKEAAYLTADNHLRYRTILRYFFIQHERMREYIYPEEVFSYVKNNEDLQEYDEDSLYLDLDQLVKWGNLIPRQEMNSPRTIEEYKKKRFRYQPTPYTIEFERLLNEMENKKESFGGALERTQFNRLYQLLQEIEIIVLENKKITNEEANQLWEDLLNYFRQIVQNTSDYIAYINSEEVEERMKTEAFLIYKDQFTKYLREFIRAMQSTSEQIKAVLSALPQNRMESFFKKVTSHKEQARLKEKDEAAADNAIEEYLDKWGAVQSWFRGTHSYGKSESEILLDRTTEAIRKITQVVQRMGERNQNFQSRREDYLHLANLFDGMETIDDAHKLFAAAFGFAQSRHYYIEENLTDNIYSEIWEASPAIHETKPMIRTYREKSNPGAVVDRSEKRKKAREAFLKEKQLERKWIDKYINEKRIELDKIEKVESRVRQIFLSWIGKAMGQQDRTIQTEFGMRVRVNLKEERIVLRSEDGTLEMPNVVFELLDRKGAPADE